jgi:hypothetical protein
MTAADLTVYSSRTQGAMPIVAKVTKVTQNDWISFKDVWGVKPPTGVVITTSAHALETFTYGILTVDNSGTAYTATDTSIVVKSGNATRLPPYYLMTGSGEIMEVTSETLPATAAGTLTVVRGRLGTTASATGLANNNTMIVLNQVFLSSSTVGPALVFASPIVGVTGDSTLYSDTP